MMIGQYPEKLKALRQMQETAKKRAKELVKGGTQIDLESIKAQALAEFADDAQIYINFLEKEITVYRHKIMAKDAELLRVADMYRRAPAEAPLSPHSPFSQSLLAKQSSAEEIKWVYKQPTAPVVAAVPKVAPILPEAARKDAKDRAGRNARSGVPLNLGPIRKRCNEKFPGHLEAYLTYYEKVFNEIQKNIQDEGSVIRLAKKRGADAVKRNCDLNEEYIMSSSLEFGQFAELYRTTYRNAFNERKAKLDESGVARRAVAPAAPIVPAAAAKTELSDVSESLSKADDEETLVIPKSFLKQYPALLAKIQELKSENRSMPEKLEKTRKRTFIE